MSRPAPTEAERILRQALFRSVCDAVQHAHQKSVSRGQLDRAEPADPTRRGMLEDLARGEANVSTLARPYSISQPAISKHMRVLENAGLIRRTRRGREHFIRVNPQPIELARTWIGHYARYWKRHFDAVEDYLNQRRGKKE